MDSDKMLQLAKRSVSATLLISLGSYCLLKTGKPIGPIFFTLGLLGCCYMNLNLFTGKCGFFIQDKIKLTDLAIILLTNLLSGYAFGFIYSFTDPDVFKNATEIAAMFEWSVPFFVKSVLCGAVMYIAVFMYKKGTPSGIIFGVPLFIFCGFQHCIANIITLGAARTLHLSIVLCVMGNFCGAVGMWCISKSNGIDKK